MKKILLVLVLMMSVIQVQAIENTNIDMKDLFQEDMYRFSEKRYHLQGYTVTDKYIVLACRYADNDHYLAVYDKKTHDLIHFYHYDNFSHANDVTYNWKTNEIVVVSDTSKELVIIDGETFQQKKIVQIDYSENSSAPRSIAYDRERDQYYVFYNDHKFYILNNQYTVESSFELASYNQGADIYGNYIYTVRWTSNTSQNYISVYDKTTHELVKQFYMENDNYRELEGIAFDENGISYLGFNTGNIIKLTTQPIKPVYYVPSFTVYEGQIDRIPASGLYTFELLENDKAIDEVKNNNEKVIFNALNYTNPGKYNYLIRRKCPLTNCDDAIDVSISVKNNPLTSELYIEESLYDGSSSINYHMKDTTIKVPNTGIEIDKRFMIFSIIIVIQGIIIIIKAQKKNS